MSEEATNSEEFSPEDETSLPESAEQSETQEETTEEAIVEEAPRKPTAKDRIDELTRLRREAEREAEYWRAKAIQAPQPQAQEEAPANTKPNPDNYDAGEFDPRYVEDLTAWKANEIVEGRLKKLTEDNERQQSEREWQSRIAKASERMPDFEDKVFRSQWACSPEMADALRAAEKGEDLAYHLASNPTEAARISRLSPSLQLMELGKLEAKLTQPQPKTVTSAPQPIPQARGSGGQFKAQPDTDDFAAFEKTYGGQ